MMFLFSFSLIKNFLAITVFFKLLFETQSAYVCKMVLSFYVDYVSHKKK